MFGNDRKALRQFYHTVWSKMTQQQSLSGLEKLVAEVIASHPEYHAELSRTDNTEREYFVENGLSNPYLHMGLHISIREQIATDRPVGIRDLYQQLFKQTGDPLETEHQMMECLTETLWQAQRSQTQPSETAYLQAVEALVNGSGHSA